MSNKRLSSVFYKWLLMLVAITLPIQTAMATPPILAPTYTYRNSLTNSNSYGLAFDGDGKLYVANCNSRTFSVFEDLDDGTTGTSYTIQDSNTPIGLAFDRSGNLYVSDTWMNQVYVFEPGTITGPSGSTLTPDLIINSSSFGSGGGHGPWGLSLDSANNLYVVGDNYGTTVSVFESSAISTALANKDTAPNPTLTPDRTLTGTGSLNGISFDGSSNLYLTDWSHGCVDIFNSTNLTGSSGSDRTIGGFNGPVAVTFDSADRMYVTNVGSGTVDILTAEGVKLNSIGTDGTESFSGPQFAVVRPTDGLLCVADRNNGRIGVFEPGPGQSAIYSSRITGLTAPTGLAFLPNGDLAVANSFDTVSAYNGTTIDTNVSAITGLTNPGAVAAYGDYFYVANNTSAGGVSVYNATTGAPVTLSNNETGSYGTPTALAAYNGQLYVANYSGGYVNAFNALTGEFIATMPGTFTSPNGLAFDASGNLYVSDSGSGNIYSYANNRGAFGPQTSLITGLISPAGLAIDQQRYLYVAEQGTSNTVQVYDLAASPPSVIGTVGGAGTSGQGLFGTPQFIAISPAPGNPIYVTDSGNDVVQVFNNLNPSAPTLQTVSPYSYSSNIPANSPNGLAFLPNGHLAVGDSANGTIAAYNGTTADSFSIGGLSNPRAMATFNNYLYVVNESTKSVSVFNATTGAPVTLPNTITTQAEPTSLAIYNNKIYVTDFYNGTVDIFNVLTGESVGNIPGFRYTNGIAFDANGNLYVSDADGISLCSGGAGVPTPLISNLPGPAGMALDQQGYLYVALDNDSNTVSVYDTTRSPPAFMGTFGDTGTPGAGSFDCPNFVAIKPDGSQVYVTDGNNGFVQIFDNHYSAINPTGSRPAIQTTYAYPYPYSSNISLSGTNPSRLSGLAFLPNGHLAIADEGNGAISDYDIAGNTRYSLSTTGTNDPIAMSVYNNYLYVANNGGSGPSVSVFNATTGDPVTLSDNSAIQTNEYGSQWTLAIYNNQLYAGANNNIRIFDALTGAYVRDLEMPTNGALQNVAGLAFDVNGNLYVSNYSLSGIYRYANTSTTPGSAPNLSVPSDSLISGINNVFGLAIDQQGYLYVATPSLNSVSVYDTTQSPPMLVGTLENGSLNDPFFVAISPDGTKIYVTDYNGNNVQSFDNPYSAINPAGCRPAIQTIAPYLASYSSASSISVTSPTGLAFLPNGELVVADGSTLSAFSGITPAPFTYEISDSHSPTAVAVYNDYIYVANNISGGGVSVFDAGTGESVTLSDNTIQTSTSYGTPDALAAHNGKIYVADYAGGNVNVFNAETGEHDSQITGFTNPSGLAFDTSGNLYVSNASGSISVWNGTGSPTALISSGLDSPAGIAIDQQGYLYVVDKGAANTFKVYKTNGDAVGILMGNTLDSPQFIAISPATGNPIYVTDSASHKVQVFTNPNPMAPALQTKYVPAGTIYGATHSSNIETNSPTGLAFLSNGKLVAANAQPNDTVSVFNSNGSPSSFTNPIISPTDPRAVAVYNNYIYVANYDAGTAAPVSVFNATTGAAVNLGTGNALQTSMSYGAPTALAAYNDKLYVADHTNGNVNYFDINVGRHLGSISGFSEPNGLAFDKNGNLYVSNSDTGTISLYSKNGTLNSAYIPNLSNPAGLAIDQNGRLYVVNKGDDTVLVYDTTTGPTFVGRFGEAGSEDGEFNSPQFIAISPDGTQIYVTDEGNNRVQVFTHPDGYTSRSALQMVSPPKPIVISPAQVAMTKSLRSSGLSSGSAAVVSAALNSGRMGAILNSMPASVGMNVATSTVTAAAVNTQVTTSTSTPASIVSTVTTTLSDAGGGAGEIQHYHGFTSSQSQKFERLNQELPFLKFQSIESMIDPINAPVSNSSPILMATPFEQPKLALKPLYMANDKNHIWVQPYGGLQKLESYDQVAGLSIKSAGGVMGAGRRVLPNVILGILGGGAVNSYTQDEKKGDGNISNMYAGVYAAYSKPEGGFRVNGSVIGSQSRYKGNRNINSLNLIAENSHKGWDASGHIQAGYKIRYGRSSSVDPFVSVGFAHSYQEAYSETNANPFNLNVSSSTTQMGSIEIGSKFERSFMVNEAIVKPLLIVSALREHPIKKPTSATLSFTESGGSFTVPVSTQIKTYATATAGCAVMLKNNVTVSALVSGKIKKHEKAVSAVLKVSYAF